MEISYNSTALELLDLLMDKLPYPFAQMTKQGHDFNDWDSLVENPPFILVDAARTTGPLQKHIGLFKSHLSIGQWKLAVRDGHGGPLGKTLLIGKIDH